MRVIPLLAAMLVGCTEYGLAKGSQDPVQAEDTGSFDPVDTDVAEDTADSGDTGVPALTDCEGIDLSAITWWGSAPFADAADPADGSGVAWYATSYTMSGWSTVSIPDSGHTPAGNDRAYRGSFELSTLPPRVYVDMQSDDGIWLYVNGAEVGHWGGGWQEEGCVNDESNCLEYVVVDPVEITDYLQVGNNLVAARVSNAIEGSWFQLYARCVEE